MEHELVQARGRRLEWILAGLALVGAGMLASLALAWSVVTVPQGALQVGSTQVALNGGTVMLTGRQLGMTEPVLVAVGVVAIGAFLAYRTWWWGTGLVVMLGLSRLGLSVPPPGGRGTTTMSQAGPGLELIRVLWPLSFALLALAAFQAYLVRQAGREETTESAGDFRATLGRVLGAAWSAAKVDAIDASTDATAATPAPASTPAAASPAPVPTPTKRPTT